jgi:GTP-binding protein
MRVKSADFVKSAVNLAQCPREGRPEIAFAGRSNVGKSTLLNVLLNRKGLAKTSKKPGKTQTINFFDVNKRLYFVDLPGYGFAKVPKHLKQTWGRAVTSYLSERESLRLAVHLVDSRHPPTRNDLELLDLLDEAQVPTLIVATKVDKLRPSELQRSVKSIRTTLALDPDALVIPYSSVTKKGLHDLWSIIDDCLAPA